MFALFLTCASSAHKKCYTCIAITEQVQKIAEKFPQKEKIIELAPQVCKIFQDEKKEICEKFTTEYIPGIVDLLENYSAKDICKKVKFCRTNPFKKVHVLANDAPVFQAETVPEWKVAWEEPI